MDSLRDVPADTYLGATDQAGQAVAKAAAAPILTLGQEFMLMLAVDALVLTGIVAGIYYGYKYITK